MEPSQIPIELVSFSGFLKSFDDILKGRSFSSICVEMEKNIYFKILLNC